MELLTRTLTFPLIKTSSRLSFRYKINDVPIRFMYDSGAKVPTWCSSENLFLKTYTNAFKTTLIANISGFGKGIEKAPVYTIPRFSLVDKENNYVINNLQIVVLHKPSIDCDFILSENMFCKTNFHIYRINGKELQIEFSDKEFYCTPMKNNKDLQDISIWSHSDEVGISPCNAFQ